MMALFVIHWRGSQSNIHNGGKKSKVSEYPLWNYLHQLETKTKCAYSNLGRPQSHMLSEKHMQN